MTPGELALWIADVSAYERRRDALRDGSGLAELARREGLIQEGEQGVIDIAQGVAGLQADGWLAFDYSAYPEDPEPPAASAFGSAHLQRCQNLRLTPEGWQAIPALRSEAERAETPGLPHGPRRDIFICHASEDKQAVARPIAERLRERGWQVWFDEFELVLGDSLREKIDEGLRISRYGAVILSPAFFGKPWPERELDGLTTRETTTGEKVILPIWHEVSAQEVAAYSAPLAGRLAATTEQGTDHVVAQLERALGARTDEPGGGEAPQHPMEAGVEAAHGGGTQAAQASDLVWRAGPEQVSRDVIEALRANDEIAITQLLDSLSRDGTSAARSDSPEVDLPELLDVTTCLAAIALTHDRSDLLERSIRVLFTIYSQGFDPHGIARGGPFPVPQLWLWIIERATALGGLAIRKERWREARTIASQRGTGYEFGYYTTWLRHGLTMASRAHLFSRQEDGRQVEVSLLALAGEVVERLDCLRPDIPPGDEAILTSLCQFDFLSALVGIDAAGEVDGRAFYPSFARFYSSRVEPFVARLLDDPDLRSVVFPRSDADLASALIGLDKQSSREVSMGGGWTGYDNEAVRAFLQANTRAS